MVANLERFSPSISTNVVPELTLLNKRDTVLDLPFRKNREVVRHFSPETTFLEYWQWRNQLGEETATRKIYAMLWGDLMSFRGEGVGDKYQTPLWTRIEPVVFEMGEQRFVEFLFQNSQYIEGQNVLKMLDNSITDLPDKGQKRRFAQENVQISELFDLLVKLEDLQRLNFSQSSQELAEQLKNEFGFVELVVPRTQNFHMVFGNDDQEEENQVTNVRNEPILVGKIIRSVSPKTDVHNQGRTSFLWLNRVAYVPSVNKFGVLRESCFSSYDDQELGQFLTLPDQAPLDLPKDSKGREKKLFQMLSVLPQEFLDQHAITVAQAITIFEEMIPQIGDGRFKKAPPIDRNVVMGNYDPENLIQFYLDVFKWEFERCQDNPSLAGSIDKRIRQWQEMADHALLSAEEISVEAMFAEYQQMFTDIRKAQNPKANRKEFEERVLRIYPRFAMPISLSKLHCAAGSVVGARQKALSRLNRTHTEMKLTRSRFADLKFYETHGFKNKEDFVKFCKRHPNKNLDPRNFRETKTNLIGEREKCKACDRAVQYVGDESKKKGCGVCGVCHVKDNYGILGESLTSDFKQFILHLISPNGISTTEAKVA